MQVDEVGFYNRLLDYHNILYLCHRNADPDAISSAFALSEAIGGTVGLVDGSNRVASLLVDKLDDTEEIFIVGDRACENLCGFVTSPGIKALVKS